MAARFARAHRTTSARPRGCTPGNSRLGQLASLVLIELPAHVRGVAPQAIRGAWPCGTSRACGSSLRSCSSNRQRTSAGLHPWQFAARGRAGQVAFLRSARAGPSAKARWRNVKVFSQVFFKKLVGFGVKPQDLTGVRGVLVPGGHRSGPTEAAAETSHRLPIHKKGGDARPQQGGTL